MSAVSMMIESLVAEFFFSVVIVFSATGLFLQWLRKKIEFR